MATLLDRVSKFFSDPDRREYIERELAEVQVRLIEARLHVDFYSVAVSELEKLLEEEKRHHGAPK